MQFFNFTPQEIRALLFLLIALLMGSGITIYKRHHPSFAPELIFKEPRPGSFKNQGPFDESSKDTSHEISKSYTFLPTSDPKNGSSISLVRQNLLKQKIDLNSASASDLELLPQIGPTLSQRIIDYRKMEGRFEKIDDLMKVSGIGPKTFEKIKNFIVVK
jgi:comEA protein